MTMPRPLERYATIESKGIGKQGFYAQIDLDQAKAYDYTTQAIAAAATTPDAQAGVAAFLEKRPPKFP